MRGIVTDESKTVGPSVKLLVNVTVIVQSVDPRFEVAGRDPLFVAKRLDGFTTHDYAWFVQASVKRTRRRRAGLGDSRRQDRGVEIARQWIKSNVAGLRYTHFAGNLVKLGLRQENLVAPGTF